MGKQYRISTGLKVLSSQWNARCHYAMVGPGMLPIDRYNNTIVNNRLRDIDVAFIKKIEYFCTNFKELKTMSDELLKAIRPDYKMPRKQKQKKDSEKSVTELMIEYRLNNNYTGERSFGTARTNILDFRKFLKESNIPDEIESMTKDIAWKYAMWLKKQNISVNTANQRIRALATNLKNLTSYTDLNFVYPLPSKLPLLKETLTGDEIEDNGVALNEEQIDKLMSLKDLSEGESIARDMFCLQCWTGVRVSDISQLLSSANLKEIDGVTFSIFRPTKTKRSRKIRSIIPLTTIYPGAFDLVKAYLDKVPSLVNTKKNTYNERIRTICRLAGLNETVKKTTETGSGKKTTNEKIWEVATSHVGRHSFITNCKRRGISDDDIIMMTGHSSTAQIKQTYDNTVVEDTARLLLGKLTQGKEQEESQAVAFVHQPIASHKYDFDPIYVLRRALKLLGENFDEAEEINLVDLGQKLIAKRKLLIKKHGKPYYQDIKDTIMQGMDPNGRETLNRFFSTVLPRSPFMRPIKLVIEPKKLALLEWGD